MRLVQQDDRESFWGTEVSDQVREVLPRGLPLVARVHQTQTAEEPEGLPRLELGGEAPVYHSGEESRERLPEQSSEKEGGRKGDDAEVRQHQVPQQTLPGEPAIRRAVDRRDE